MKFNSAFVFLVLVIAGRYVFAQQAESATQKENSHSGLYAIGGFGPAIPVGSFGKERQPGFDFNTAVEYRFKKGLIVRGMFDFSTFQFNLGTISQNSNGNVYEVGGSNNVVSLLASGGYYFQKGRFSPYGFAGLGASFVSKPEITVDEVKNSVDIGLLVKGYFSTVAGVGVDFILNPIKENETEKKSLFLIYVESFYTYIPTRTEISVHKFSLLSLNLGIKSKF